MSNGNVVFSSKMASNVPALSPAKVILWEPNVQLEVALYPTTCCLQHTKRKTKPSNKVSTSPILPNSLLTVTSEAAIDANAPLEDEDAALGPVDSDEELTSVMHGLTNWNPQPLVQPLIQMPIEREYQKKRLYEQLHNATNGFTINICKVVGLGAQKLAPGMEDGDGEGDDEPILPGMQPNRRPGGFNLSLPPGRRPSVAVQR